MIVCYLAEPLEQNGPKRMGCHHFRTKDGLLLSIDTATAQQWITELALAISKEEI